MPVWLFSKPVLYALAVAAVAGLVVWYYNHVYQSGYSAATQAVEAKYALRDRDAEAAANKRIRRLELDKTATEQRHAVDLSNISVKFQQDSQNADSQIAVLRRDVAAGKRVFSDPGRAVAGSGSCLPGVAAAASRSLSAPGTELPATDNRVLSSAATEFLIAIGSECDAAARQANAAAEVIRSDRAR